MFWHDTPVGFHRVSIRPSGAAGGATIRTAIRVRVELAVFTLYRLEHDSEEVWEGGRLVRLDSRSDDDGDAFRVAGRLTARGFEMTGPHGTSLVPGDLPPSNAVWSQDALSWPEMIDSQRGGVMRVRVRELGTSSLAVNGTRRPARGYAFATPFTRGESWYDAAGQWVKMRLAKDDEWIDYRLSS